MQAPTGDGPNRLTIAKCRRRLTRFVRRNIARLRPRKIFGIGLSRTGTQSLDLALSDLGYYTVHHPYHLLILEGGTLSFDMLRVSTHEALSDLPVARLFKELYRAFPGSKSILTVRDKEAWLNSCSVFFPRRDALRPLPGAIRQLRSDLYDTPRFDRQAFSEAYDRHTNTVRSYFKGVRPIY